MLLGRWEVLIINPLSEAAKRCIASLNRSQVAIWFANHDAHSLDKAAKKHFKKTQVIVAEVDAQWQGDLFNLQQFSKHNDSVTYILMEIDILSKYAWTFFLKGKTCSEIAVAFETILLVSGLLKQ